MFGRGLFSRNLCLCLQCVKIRELLIQRSYKNNIVITKFTFVTHFALNHGTLQGNLGVKKSHLLFIFRKCQWIRNFEIESFDSLGEGAGAGMMTVFNVCRCLFKKAGNKLADLPCLHHVQSLITEYLVSDLYLFFPSFPSCLIALSRMEASTAFWLH